MRSVPPSGIASRAFTARFRSAISIWFGSALAAGRSSATSTATLIWGPVVLATSSAIPVTSLAMSTAVGWSGCRRAKASSR